MAGESTEMDSLFEGMDFVMPVKKSDDADPPQALEPAKVAQKGSKPSVPSAPAVLSRSPSLDPLSLLSGPDLGLSSRSSTTVNPLSDPPSRSLSPTFASSPMTTNPGEQQQQLRDHSEPLDESLFSGLTLAVAEDEAAITQFNPESTNGTLTNSATGGFSTTADAAEKVLMDTIPLHGKSGSSDDPSGGVRIGGNADKDGGGSTESIMSAYNDGGSPYLSASSSLKKNSSSTTGTTAPSSSIISKGAAGLPPSTAASPPVIKPSMRRKKRSMKIGYGRDDEENEELGSRKAGVREAFGAALLGGGGRDFVSNSSSTSTPMLGLSRESSQNGLSVEESTFALASSAAALRVDIPRLNEVELQKENSASLLSSGSQYSTLEVNGIERVESRDISREFATQLESEKPEVIPSQSKIAESDKQSSSPEKDRRQGSPGAETRTRSDVEVASELPSTAVEETTTPDSEASASKPPGLDPEDTAPSIENGSAAPKQEEEQEEGGAEAAVVIPDTENGVDLEPLSQPREGTIEERLEFIKEAVAHTLKALHEKMSAVSALRKTAVQKRRRAAEKVAAALATCMELEAELSAACEREDFDKADSVSGMIAEAETSMAQAGEAFGVAEAASDSTASKVQDVLELQVAVEEQGATFLEALKQEAEEAADRTLTEAQDFAGREAERLEVEAKAIEVRKKTVDLELNGVDEAKDELNRAIGALTKSESEEKAALTEKGDQLGAELQELLKLVKMKEAEIAESDERIAEVDRKISSVAANFETRKADLDAQLETIAITVLQLEKDSSVVTEGRQGIERLLSDAEEKRCRLQSSAGLAFDAGKAMRDAVKIKKSVAVSIMQSSKKRAELAEKEKQAQAEAQLLRQNAASARVLLQELTSSKAKLGQELGAVQERIAFAEKRAPELDAEKKLAAAARNFKAAGRLAAEAKVLKGEKEAASADMARVRKELETVEGEAEVKLHALADLDSLIASKAKEGAMAHCKRLRLVAAAARDERDVAVELDDFDEAESLDAEAKAADTEAEALQRLYQLEGSAYESHDSSSSLEDVVSMDSEAAMADCERLRLVAAAAREEMDAAAERDQFDEAETFHSNAETADAEADRLQNVYQLEGRRFERRTNSNVSDDTGLKEKGSAMGECEKLRMVASSAHDERDAAVELDEFEEAEAFDSKAEAADAEADRLQKLFQLEGKQYERKEKTLGTVVTNHSE